MNVLVCYRKSWNTYQTREEKLPANQLEISLDVILEMVVVCVCLFVYRTVPHIIIFNNYLVSSQIYGCNIMELCVSSI